MPRVTKWFLRSAIAYLVAGLALGVINAGLSLGIAISISIPTRALFPLYVHLLVVGWTTQLIFGVAYWMFPRYSKEQVYGHARLAWWAFALLNAGLALRVVGEPAHAYDPRPPTAVVMALSALLQGLGGLAFVATIWPRIKEH
ncbi:MAG: cbb3-type cytochrome c oxidase subunit I [Chloroflexi bacterium]|nr:cbb3-type cytochrome c oxidase subunit I [Chloroflexota bacterium]